MEAEVGGAYHEWRCKFVRATFARDIHYNCKPLQLRTALISMTQLPNNGRQRRGAVVVVPLGQGSSRRRSGRRAVTAVTAFAPTARGHHAVLPLCTPHLDRSRAWLVAISTSTNSASHHWQRQECWGR